MSSQHIQNVYNKYLLHEWSKKLVCRGVFNNRQQ